MINEILETARREIGYHEGAGNDNKYGQEYGLNGQPWCVIFQWWCFKHSGCAELFPNTAHCDGVRSYAKGIGRWINPAEIRQTAGLKAGDLVVWDYDYDGSGDHIGIIEKVTGRETFTTIEGNYADGVCRVNRNLEGVSGIYRPAYDELPDDEELEAVDEKPRPAANPIVYMGRKGIFVSLLQAKLKIYGFDCGVIDGEFGGNTEIALKEYQRDRGLAADGICGDLTWASLWEGGV